MDITTHPARITTPISYLEHGGRQRFIPIGPCMLETHGGEAVDIVWGAHGQRSTEMPREDVKAARDLGHLVLLD